MFRIISILLIAFFTLIPYSIAQAETSSPQKAVLVTGASSGLGRAMERLVELNAKQKYSYDREALIEMLDKAMSQQ